MPYVYLLQCPYFKDDIFKIGGSEKIENDRLKSYGKGTKILAMIVLNCDYREVENQIKVSFNSKFTLIHGKEYFQGNQDEIKLEFLKIVYNHQMTNSQKMAVDTVVVSKVDTVVESKVDTVVESKVDTVVESKVDTIKYNQKSSEQYLHYAVNECHNDIAKALYENYRDTFVCSSITNKTWYQFRNHRWEQIEYGVLRVKFSSDIANIFGKMGHEIWQKIAIEENRDHEESLKIKLKTIEKMYKNCKLAPFKNNVMNEAMKVFYDHKFNSINI